jgi:hypothetical protein
MSRGTSGALSQARKISLGIHHRSLSQHLEMGALAVSSATVNVLWTPVRGAQFGIEYEWYHRTVWSGAHGSSNRIKAQSLFSF